jgi:hypothetical protein
VGGALFFWEGTYLLVFIGLLAREVRYVKLRMMLAQRLLREKGVQFIYVAIGRAALRGLVSHSACLCLRGVPEV